jgi:hypothetical protein
MDILTIQRGKAVMTSCPLTTSEQTSSKPIERLMDKNGLLLFRRMCIN